MTPTVKTPFIKLDEVIRYARILPCGKCGAKVKYYLERRPESPDAPRPWGARWVLIVQCLGHGEEFGPKVAIEVLDVTPDRLLESADMIYDWVKMIGRLRPFAKNFAFYRWEHSSRAHHPQTTPTR